MAPIRTTQADLSGRRTSPTLTHLSASTGSSTSIGGIALALPGTGGVRSTAAPYSTSPPGDRSPVLSRPRTTASSTGGLDSLSSSPTTSSSTVATSVLSTSPTAANEFARAQQAAVEAAEPSHGRVRARASVFAPRRSSATTKSPTRMSMPDLQSAIKSREHMLNGPNSAALPPDCRRHLTETVTAMQRILADRQALIDLETNLDHASLDPDARDERNLLSQLHGMKLRPHQPADVNPPLPDPATPADGRRRCKIQFLSAPEDQAMQRQIRAAEREENEYALTLPTAADDGQDLLDQQRCIIPPSSYPSCALD